MQGDVVRSRTRTGDQLGWVCCITPESDEGHVYWQPCRGTAPADSREPLKSLMCADRALIPGDIVRRSDIATGEASDTGGRERDVMGMVVGTEVMLDLMMLNRQLEEANEIRRGLPATSLRHLVPIRLATWVVHRVDGWLGRLQSWDEDLTLRFVTPESALQGTSNRCRIRAANMKQGLAIVEGFYRDFFPGLTVSVSLQDLRAGSFECEWLSGCLSNISAAAGTPATPSEGNCPPRKIQACIEEVSVGNVRVEWITQVPLRRGVSSDHPPKSEGCLEDKLLFLLGEAELSSRWALGDRLRLDGDLAEICGVETCVDVRWQDNALSVRVPARELELCNPDAFSFFPSELVCQRTLLEEASADGMLPRQSAVAPGAGADHAQPQGGGAAGTGDRAARRDDQQPRLGYVLDADPASRMVRVRWLEDRGVSSEEWSTFDLQIDPEYGYRLGDAVIRCHDWEDHSPSSRQSGEDSAGPRVGQVAALEAGSVRVRWLDGSLTLHAPKELYRIGDEEEASVAESEVDRAAFPDGEAGSRPASEAAAPSAAARAAALAKATAVLDAADERDEAEDGAEADSASKAGTQTSHGQGHSDAGDAARPTDDKDGKADTDKVGEDVAGNGDAGATVESSPSAAPDAPAAGAAEGTAGGSPPAGGDAAVGDSRAEVSLEDMVWEPLPSDHMFLHSPQLPAGPQGRRFMRRVQSEWQILQRGLPHGVWVHVYPDRMELLRACLVGPEGTPYSEALFFFDVHLPPTYPQVPPQVRFWSFGEHLNPNLYENGKVCLSLLGTWSGKDSETWSPERSNLLQVLVSILGLVLNTEPYYNEPGFERERDTPQGELRSRGYNESVALSSYHLMLRVLRAPPADFDQLAKRHFAQRRSAILDRARSLQNGETACSEGFRKSLAALLPRLEEALPKDPPP